jgi:hypothetical protein
MLSRLTGRTVHDSVAVFPPFYSEFGKNLRLGRGVFINIGCRFQDTGGITIGDGTLIGHGSTRVASSLGNRPSWCNHRGRCHRGRRRGRRQGRTSTLNCRRSASQVDPRHPVWHCCGCLLAVCFRSTAGAKLHTVLAQCIADGLFGCTEMLAEFQDGPAVCDIELLCFVNLIKRQSPEFPVRQAGYADVPFHCGRFDAAMGDAGAAESGLVVQGVISQIGAARSEPPTTRMVSICNLFCA